LAKVKLIDRFNEYVNKECAASPWGTLTSMEHLEATTIRAVLYAFARKYNLKESIPCDELKQLADILEKQGNESNKRHQTAMKLAQETTSDANDAL
jgi:hypothetical protein